MSIKNLIVFKMSSDEIHQHMLDSGCSSMETEYSPQTFLVKIVLGDGAVFPLVYAFQRDRAKKIIMGVSSDEDIRRDIIIHRNHIIPSSLEEIYAVELNRRRREIPDAFFTY
jgi:hypothetical protein